MSIDLNRDKELLTNENQTAYLLEKIVEKNFGKPIIGSVIDAVQELVEIDKVGSKEVSESLSIVMLLFNTEAIFKYAQSPIEKIFLNTLNILSFPYKDIFLEIIHSQIDVGDLEPAIFMPQEAVVDFWRRYQKLSYKNNISSFLDMMVEVAGINDRQKKKALLDLLSYYIAKLYGLYYVALQPTIKDVPINGKSIRPDIYIWPTNDEKFKLIIECDGYSYHADKVTFSRDRARDRQLHMNGFKVLRFSGSDIVANPVGMAKELRRYLVEQKSKD